MPTIYNLKPKFQGLLRPFVGYLAKIGVTANTVTCAACGLSLLLAVAMVLNPTNATVLWLFIGFGALRMAMNAIDGMLAREFNQASPLGAVLNETTDGINDAALYLALGLHSSVPFAWVAVLVAVALVSEIAGLAHTLNDRPRCYAGPFGKSDRAVFFAGIALLLVLQVAVEDWVGWVLAGAILLSCVTVVNRIRAVRHV